MTAISCLAAALLLAAAGVAKLRDPVPAAETLRALGVPGRRATRQALIRCGGLVELAVAAAVATRGDRVSHVLLLLAYAGFAAVVVTLMTRGASVGCGCFGARSQAPTGRAHLVVVLGALAAAVAGVVHPVGAWTGLVDLGALAAVVAGAQAALLAATGYLALTALPAMNAARRLFETDRRSRGLEAS